MSSLEQLPPDILEKVCWLNASLWSSLSLLGLRTSDSRSANRARSLVWVHVFFDLQSMLARVRMNFQWTFISTQQSFRIRGRVNIQLGETSANFKFTMESEPGSESFYSCLRQSTVLRIHAQVLFQCFREGWKWEVVQHTLCGLSWTEEVLSRHQRGLREQSMCNEEKKKSDKCPSLFYQMIRSITLDAVGVYRLTEDRTEDEQKGFEYVCHRDRAIEAVEWLLQKGAKFGEVCYLSFCTLFLYDDCRTNRISVRTFEPSIECFLQKVERVAGLGRSSVPLYARPTYAKLTERSKLVRSLWLIQGWNYVFF